jgi:hypothetical protein
VQPGTRPFRSRKSDPNLNVADPDAANQSIVDTPRPPTDPYPVNPDILLRDELARVSFLVRAFLLRYAPRPVAEPSGSRPLPAACEAVLNDPFRWIDPQADPDSAGHSAYLMEAARLEQQIIQRLRRTREEVRFKLPVWELVRRFGLVPNLQAVVPPYSTDVPRDGLEEAPAPVRDTVALDVLLLSLLIARLPTYRAAIAAVAPELNGATLTVEIALRILQPNVPPAEYRWQEFSPTGPLVGNQLITLTPTAGLGQESVQIDFRVAQFLGGKEPSPDPVLGEAAAFVHKWRGWDSVRLDPPVVEQLQRLSAWWWQDREGVPLVALLQGPWGAPFLEVAQALLTRESRTASGTTKVAWPVLVVDATAGLRSPDWAEFVRRVYREATFRQAVVLWTHAECLLTDNAADGKWHELIRRAEQASTSTFLASQIGWDPTGLFRLPQRYFVRVDLPIPSPQIRRGIWKSRLAREQNGLASDAGPAEQAALDLLETFEFTQGEIEDAIATARGLALVAADVPAEHRAAQSADHLAEACRRQAARRSVSFAQRIPPRLTADDRAVEPKEVLRRRVVLPVAQAHQLGELFDKISHLNHVYHDLGFEQRMALGRGIVALFTGSPGTGKTLAATTLAKLLQKDLYKVDASAVASRHVGETEKNLGRVFADVQGANAILFFDEADALFGKRGEVVQASDRWANLQISYLLQRIEEYSGTVILATNYRENIDPAFFRRMQVLIDFPRPDPAGRLSILEGLFAGIKLSIADVAGRVAETPDAVRAVLKPVADRFELSGGNLKNVVVDAAFRAVANTTTGPTVTIRELLLGVARETQKEGKPLSVVTFGKEWYGFVEKELRLGRA